MHSICRVLALAGLLQLPACLLAQGPDAVAPAGSAAAAASAAAADTAYRSDPKFTKALEEARLLQRQKRMAFAADGYKKANKIAGGKCVECLAGLFDAQMADGDYKDALATATAWEPMAATPVQKSRVEERRGQALFAEGGEKPKPAQLEAAHAAFQQALANYPKNVVALYQDGMVLARMGRMDDARAAFQQCASCVSPTDPARLRAQHFSENPELSLHKMAPPFEVEALDGQHFNLDAMGGRVVLIDFWATWCGPCNEELPHMKRIAKEFAGQPLVIISVSWDSDPDKWKAFIQKNEMTWVQYRDADHKLSDKFGINAIPHYFTIDSDGVLTAEMVGEGSDVEGKLKKLLARAREARPASAPALQTRGN